MKLNKKQRDSLRMRFGGCCAYCGCELPEKGWHADHGNPIYRITEVDEAARLKGIWRLKNTGRCHYPENDCMDNMMPACAYCNINKSSMDIETFRKFIESRTDALMKTTAGKMSVKYLLCELKPKPVVFWFEQYQRQESAA